MKIPKTWRRHFIPEGEKCHFVQCICDGGYTLIVYKIWFRSRKRWGYFIEPKWLLEIQLEKYKRLNKKVGER